MGRAGGENEGVACGKEAEALHHEFAARPPRAPLASLLPHSTNISDRTAGRTSSPVGSVHQPTINADGKRFEFTPI